MRKTNGPIASPVVRRVVASFGDPLQTQPNPEPVRKSVPVPSPVVRDERKSNIGSVPFASVS